MRGEKKDLLIQNSVPCEIIFQNWRRNRDFQDKYWDNLLLVYQPERKVKRGSLMRGKII